MVKIIKMAKGAFTTTDITVDSSGRVIKASSGSAGGGAFEPKLIAEGPASGNHTTSGNTSTIGAYIYAGGGGGGAGGNGVGGEGGYGGFGYYSAPVDARTAYGYNVGAGGATTSGVNAPAGNAGAAGGETVFTNIGTVNGGAGGAAALDNPPGGTATAGSAPGATFTYSDRNFYIGGNTAYGEGEEGTQKSGPGTRVTSNPPGTKGALIVFENTG